MIRVVIGDDHTLMREGLKQLLEGDGVTVAGEACDGNEVIAMVRQGGFDVLLLDLSMPGRSGIELIKTVRAEAPKIRILVLSMHSERQYAVRALKAGASGYLTKESAPEQLREAVIRVASGGVFVTSVVGELLAVEHGGAEHEVPHRRLTDREFEVFRLLAAGSTVSAIALRLHLSSKTVSTHKARLMEKLGVESNAGLIRYALAHGFDDSRTDPA